MSAPDYEQQAGYIRTRWRYLGGTGDSKAYAEYISLAPATPLGHTEATVGTTPVQLPNIPPACRRVVIQSLNEDLTFVDDGSTPSATHGMIIPEITPFVYDTDPTDDFWMWAPATTDVRIAYYG